MSEQDEFYIGYESGMPASLRRRVIGAIVVTFTTAIVAATIFVLQQRGLAEARFDYANERTFEGYLSLTPIPALLVPNGSGATTYWLVAPGKFAAAAALEDARPGWVTLGGTLIERESWRMIEVRRGSIRQREAMEPAPPALTADGRRISLRGEIVDGKCYLGVMNPGERTVHRDCAVRCISGGVPPMFAYRDDTGSHLAMLIGVDPGTIARDIGRPVTLSGILAGPDESRVFDISRAQ